MSSKVAIDTRWLATPATGIGQYITALIGALDPAAKQYQLSLLGTPPVHLPKRFEMHRLQDKPQWFMENYWHLLPYPKADQLAGRPDLWHFTNYSILPTSRPYVLTVYDLVQHYYPEYVAEKTLKRLRKYLPKSLAGAAHVLAISEATKRSFVEHLKVPEEKITVTPLAPSPIFSRPVSRQLTQRVREKYDLPEKYVLAVGTLEPRKNLATLLKAYAQLKPSVRLPLVVVGGQGWLFDKTKQLLAELGLENEVIFTGYAPDEELPALYRGATLFAFPTHYEGFGIPVVEAMRIGTPVVCARTSSLPEVAGSAAAYFDPSNPAELADVLRQLLSSATERKRLAAAGKQQAATFSWERTARETAAVYAEVLGQHG